MNSGYIDLMQAIEDQAREDLERVYETAIRKKIACEKGRPFTKRTSSQTITSVLATHEERSAIWWLSNRRLNSRMLNEMLREAARYKFYCEECSCV